MGPDASVIVPRPDESEQPSTSSGPRVGRTPPPATFASPDPASARRGSVRPSWEPKVYIGYGSFSVSVQVEMVL